MYRNAYGGLSQAAWILALIMLINRSGSMVVPFLSVYLTVEVGLTLERAGIILSIFGLGSMAGSFLGGWLTDRFGQFRVQFLSLTVGGLLFFVMGEIRQFEWLAVWIFILSLVTDCLRPANASSIALYARPENITRAFSLNRMAINLGFSIGPAVGGLLAAISYQWLFVTDGLTCIMAGLLFFFFFRGRKPNTPMPVTEKAAHPASQNIKKTAWHDARFLIFILCCTLFAIVFFQLFFTLPLYYRDVYKLSEGGIGLLIGLNGLIVFLFEMVIVYLVGQKADIRMLIISGTLLVGLSFIMLIFISDKWMLYLSMIVLSFAEIFAMPYMVTYTTQRSGPQTMGSYMGLYSLAYATAFVMAPFLGTRIIANIGYDCLWWTSAALSVLSAMGFYFVLRPQSSPITVAST